MESTEIIEKIQGGLKRTAEKYNIPAKDIQINISKSFGMLGASLKLTLMNANQIVQDSGKPATISISELFDIDKLKEIFVKGFLMDKLNLLSERNNLDKNAVNATIFTRDLEYTPALRLQEQLKIIKEITVQELTS